MAKNKNKLPSTQKYLNISEIKNDCIILKDGTLRVVLLASSINFALKSEDEQKAVVESYVQFLNSVDFPFQIVIQSRPFNINPYISKLDELKSKQENDLLKSQMTDYTEFVQELVKLGDIMSKRFYLVIPYNPLGDKSRGFTKRLFDLFSAGQFIKLRRSKFEKYREKAFQRADRVSSALSAMGVKSVPLDTQSLIELYYNAYNLSGSKTQKMAKVKDLNVEQL